MVALSKCLAMELSSCILTLLRRSSGGDRSCRDYKSMQLTEYNMSYRQVSGGGSEEGGDVSRGWRGGRGQGRGRSLSGIQQLLCAVVLQAKGRERERVSRICAYTRELLLYTKFGTVSSTWSSQAS